MNNRISISPFRTITKIIISGVVILIFSNCSTVKPLTTASSYRYTMDDEVYRIRSISSVDNGGSYNELIGSDFVAVDFDKDRILDKISLGEGDLAKSQIIYEYGLNLLKEKDKLQICHIEKVDYTQENSEFDYQIKSFQPAGEKPFNQFKIIRKHELRATEVVLIDQNADGSIDNVLKGPVDDIGDYQERYNYVLKAGLEKHKLEKMGDNILVKIK